MPKRKIALFGGTFDPIHLGHTNVAAEAAEHIGAERTVFIPAKYSPLKGFPPEASNDDRLKMIALAIAENKSFQLSDYELKQPKQNYTLETVRQFQADYGSDVLICWLIGADSIDELQYWYKIVELIDECNLCTMFRSGCAPPDFTRLKTVWGSGRAEKLQQNIIKTSLIDISSTEARRRLAAGLDVSGMLHPRVEDYIHKHGLYQSRAKP